MAFLRLFAGASLEGEQGPLIGPAAQRHRLALLALLAAAHPRAVPRERLVAWLWPERDSDHARNLLSKAVHAVRQALGETAIVATGNELRLDPEVVACDVVQFEQVLAAGELERAASLHAGPFLDGFFLRDAPEFERWVDGERERYRRDFCRALEGLAERAAGAGDFAGAAEWWRRRAAEEPYNARVTVRLMEALEATGDRAGALQQARVHAALVAQEFEAEPDPAVEALAERLRSSPTATGADPVRAPAVRESALAQPPLEPDAANVRVGAPPVRPVLARHRVIGRRMVALPVAAALGLVALLAVARLLSERGAPTQGAAVVTPARTSALAVLPCTNLSGDPEEEYFSDGLTEELIGVLSQVRALRVVARTSTFAFKGEMRDIREIGELLDAGTLLECSVRRWGERVRVTAQLISAADGLHLWADTYEREGTDIFAIQSELALRIADALRAELTPAERARLAQRPTASPEAHALYLKGLHVWNQRNREGFSRAIEFFERAIEVDPQYAAAHAGLAIIYSLQGLSGALAPQDARERMRVAVATALELDGESSEAHAVLGAWLNVYEWDSEASERAYLRSLDLNPNYGTARHLYANLLRVMGRPEEAIVQRQRAVERDPLAPQLTSTLGYALVEAGRPDEALTAFRDVLELDSTFAGAHAGIGYYYESMGRFEEAVQAHRRAVELPSANPHFRMGLARVLALGGRADEARAMLGELQAEAASTGIYAPGVAWVLLALDDVDGALAWLERSYQQRHPSLRFIGGSDERRLANDPRYLDLRRRIGLPP